MQAYRKSRVPRTTRTGHASELNHINYWVIYKSVAAHNALLGQKDEIHPGPEPGSERHDMEQVLHRLRTMQ